ncbi:hypothetical protein BpHYR1_038580 [Brachionus plicatilis]|uniref:Uncharacterized protein n=1 Tax=Brachionus plicatilis TaxID=10195 RepID=A0A3M7T999_BRAPC|nr:hypothetical protein BpHYR1_038580 [Brachionus plicatilis]
MLDLEKWTLKQLLEKNKDQKKRKRRRHKSLHNSSSVSKILKSGLGLELRHLNNPVKKLNFIHSSNLRESEFFYVLFEQNCSALKNCSQLHSPQIYFFINDSKMSNRNKNCFLDQIEDFRPNHQYQKDDDCLPPDCRSYCKEMNAAQLISHKVSTELSELGLELRLVTFKQL